MPLTPKGEKILSSMEETYGPEKAERVLYASQNAGTISGIDTAWHGGGPFGTMRDQANIGADPGLPEPDLSHPQHYPGESAPPEPAVPSGPPPTPDQAAAAGSPVAPSPAVPPPFGGLATDQTQVYGGLAGGIQEQRWGQTQWGDGLPSGLTLGDIREDAEGWAAQWLPR